MRAALPQQHPLGRRLDDHVGDERRKFHVVGSDGQQQQIEHAVRLLPAGGASKIAQSLSWAGSRT